MPRDTSTAPRAFVTVALLAATSASSLSRLATVACELLVDALHSDNPGKPLRALGMWDPFSQGTRLLNPKARKGEVRNFSAVGPEVPF